MSELQPHTRINDILLGPLERPALRWLAAHMPAWVTPDILTITGIFGASLALVGYLASNVQLAFLWLACLGMVINWFGDSLDGTLARYRHIERPKYGFFVDHTVDAFNTVLILLGLALSPVLSFSVAVMALIGYLLLSILVYVRTYVDGVFKISFGRLGPTEMRTVIVLLTLYAFFFGSPILSLSFGQVNVFDVVAGFLALGFVVVYLNSVIKGARELTRIEGKKPYLHEE
ncbi:MAG: CDP-alcohol phosphatidyltransferase family protein [Caldilineales bacterium]|nr:CDP-alcohol phosphatidyltransferase family protein [Caldilineales bacterium]